METCQCPLKAKNITDQETWTLLHHQNKNLEGVQRKIPRGNRTSEQLGKGEKQHALQPQNSITPGENTPTPSDTIWENTVCRKTENRQAKM